MSEVEELPEDDSAAHGGALADHPLTARRLAKVEAMRKRGEEPYPEGG